MRSEDNRKGEKDMKKRWLSLLLVMALLATMLAGCKVQFSAGGGFGTVPTGIVTEPTGGETDATEPSEVNPTQPSATQPSATQPTGPKPTEPAYTITLESSHKPTAAASIPRLSFELTEQKMAEIVDDLYAFRNAFLSGEDLDWINTVYDQCEADGEYLGDQYTIAEFYYKSDLQNSAFSESYLYVSDMYYSFVDAYIEIQLAFYQLNNNASREFFSTWTEDEIGSLTSYDPKISQLEKENDALVVEYEKLTEYEEAFQESVTVDS